jgi:hypothetical protein
MDRKTKMLQRKARAAKQFISEIAYGSIKNDKGLTLKEVRGPKTEYGSHYMGTPDHIIEEMIGLLNINKDSKIMVPYSIDIVHYLLVNNYTNVTFLSDCDQKKSVIMGEDFGSLSEKNIILFKDIFNAIQDIKDKNMKFDAIIMNPPYGKLAPKILKTLVEEKVADEIVTIQPLHQFTTLKPQGEKNRLLKDGNNISDYVEKIIIKDGKIIVQLSL